MKVFVLICESIIDDEQSISCDVFETRNEATYEMDNAYKEWKEKKGFGEDERVEVTDDSICVFAERFFSCNHISWAVYEKDTAPDEFQLPYMAITRGDLERRGYDTSKISDATMQSLADDMSNFITDLGADWQTAFDESIRNFNIPRKEE